jgi:tripartite-type tricarboxylate transporter receptor subunit TctC
MKLPRRQFLHVATGAAALSGLPRLAWSQNYPTRPITMIMPFTPGGGSDSIGRIVGERMRASLGQPIVIENVAGANGSIGVGRAARAAPDGYTLVMGLWNTHVANGALFGLSYDVVKDFQPIALIASNPMLIDAKKAMPATSLLELVAWLKANPDKASQGTVGVGSLSHLAPPRRTAAQKFAETCNKRGAQNWAHRTVSPTTRRHWSAGQKSG